MPVHLGNFSGISVFRGLNHPFAPSSNTYHHLYNTRTMVRVSSYGSVGGRPLATIAAPGSHRTYVRTLCTFMYGCQTGPTLAAMR